MALTLNKIGITTGNTVEAYHVTQSIDAFTGTAAYDINLSGSFAVTGSVSINGITSSPLLDIVVVNTANGRLHYTSSAAFTPVNYYTSSVANNYTSSTVNNNFNTSSVVNNYTASTVNTYTNNPGGSDTQIQFNSASTFQSSPYFKYNYSNNGLAQGNSNSATGQYSHAEGSFTLASNGSSHAEGTATIASGGGSHAEGIGATSTGTYSHAEGSYTLSSGYASHAEGDNTRATGIYSHAEGSGSLSSGTASLAVGFQTTASGNYSLAVGFQNKALGQASFAGGLQTIANGPYAFSIGYLTYADNTAFAAGFSNSASGQYSFALGDTTKTIGLNSFTAGRGTIASGSQQFVIGEYNTQGDNTSIFIVGNGILGNPKDAFKVRMSGSIVLPTTQSVAPSWAGTNGEIIPATVGGVHLLYMWMAGAWRSSSFS